MKLAGTNFQSLATFDLDISGLTVIVGPSNKGKSAIFRALRGLFRNELPAEYIRNGTPGLELTAVLDGQTVIAGRRVNKSTVYTIGETGAKPKAFAKLNQAVPPELRAFGMNEVEIGDFTIDPIFARQNGKQFLVDTESYGPTELNTILGAFASTEKLEAGKKTANLEIQHKNSEAKTLAEEVNVTETRKAELTTLTAAVEAVSQGLESLEPEIKALELKDYWLVEAKARLQRLLPLQDALSRLTIPETQELESLARGRSYAIQATNSFRFVRICKRAQEGLDTAVATWTSAGVLRQRIQALNELVSARAKHVVQPVEPLTIVIDSASRGIAAAKTGHLGTIYLDLCQRWLEQVMTLKTRLQNLDEELLAVSTQFSQVQDQIRESQKVICPQCGLKFDPSHHCEAK
jgi:energy-coupling factor transporter ATP-binding protein EcfA2